MLFRVFFLICMAFTASALARISSISVKGPVKSNAQNISVTFHTENYIQNNRQYSAVFGVSPANSKIYPGTVGKYLLPNATDLTDLPGLYANKTYSVSFGQKFGTGQYTLFVATLESIGASNQVFVANHTANFTIE